MAEIQRHTVVVRNPLAGRAIDDVVCVRRDFWVSCCRTEEVLLSSSPKLCRLIISETAVVRLWKVNAIIRLQRFRRRVNPTKIYLLSLLFFIFFLFPNISIERLLYFSNYVFIGEIRKQKMIIIFFYYVYRLVCAKTRNYI